MTKNVPRKEHSTPLVLFAFFFIWACQIGRRAGPSETICIRSATWAWPTWALAQAGTAQGELAQDGLAHRTGDGHEDRRTDGQTDRPMDGQADGRTNRRTDGRTDGRADTRADGWTDRWTDGRTGGQMDGRTDGRTGGQKDGRMGGQMCNGLHNKNRGPTDPRMAQASLGTEGASKQGGHTSSCLGHCRGMHEQGFKLVLSKEAVCGESDTNPFVNWMILGEDPKHDSIIVLHDLGSIDYSSKVS